jgi:hypothetical protein
MGYFADRVPTFQRGSRGWGSGPGPLITDFQQNPANIPLEASADMFLNWVFRTLSPTGTIRVDSVSTSSGSPENGCIPIDQQLLPSDEDWQGFLNRLWDTNTFDWGLSGDIRAAYMGQLLVDIVRRNVSW